MPISPITKQPVDTTIRYEDGQPWPIRVNNSGSGGGFSINETTILLRSTLPTVIIGWQPLLGILPPRSTYDSFIGAIKSKELPNPGKLSPNDQILEFARKHLMPYVFVTHVPLPSALDAIPDNLKAYWPKGVVTGSFFRSLGLKDSDQSLLGPMGLLPLLRTSGKNIADVLTLIEFDKKGEGTDRSYHINNFKFIEPTAEDVAETAHIKACREFIKQWTKAHPEAVDFPLPANQLMVDLPVEEILSPDKTYAALAETLLKVQADAVLPPDELKQLELGQVVEALMVSGSMSNLSLAAAEDAVIQTVEVKAIA